MNLINLFYLSIFGWLITTACSQEENRETRKFVVKLNCSTEDECSKILDTINSSLASVNLTDVEDPFIDLDECQQLVSPCPELTNCTSTFYSYKCLCISGYVTYSEGINPSNVSCIDVNECELNVDDQMNCSSNATCINLDGSYTCECKDGFRDLDPTNPGRFCEELPCSVPNIDFGYITCNKSIVPNECQLICLDGFEYRDESKSVVKCTEKVDEKATVNIGLLTKCTAVSTATTQAYIDETTRPYSVTKATTLSSLSDATNAIISITSEPVNVFTEELSTVQAFTFEVTTEEQTSAVDRTTASYIEATTLTPDNLTESNIEDVAEELLNDVQSIFDKTTTPNATVVNTIVENLEKIIFSNITINKKVATDLLRVITTFLSSDTDTDAGAPDTNKFALLTDQILLNIQLPGNQTSFEVVSESSSYGAVDVDLQSTQGLYFSLPDGLANNLLVSGISIPSTLPIKGVKRISFLAFEDAKLYQTKTGTVIKKSKEIDLSKAGSFIVNSPVIGSTVKGLQIRNLSDPVIIKFKPYIKSVDEQHNDNSTAIRAALRTPKCAFFNYNSNNGSGDWSTEGCTTTIGSDDTIICNCYHLTSFAVIMDIDTMEHDYVLEYLSYFGCALSILGLTITIITYLGFRTLRAFKSKKILVHFSTALLGLYLTYVFGLVLDLPVNEQQCIASGFFMQFFLAAAFSWMFVEVLDMYFLFVKVWSSIQNYVEKMAVIGWGFPLVLSVSTLAAHKIMERNAEGSNFTRMYPKYEELTTTCWLTDIGFHWSLLLPLGIILAFNCMLFGKVTYNITCKRNGNSSAVRNSRRNIKAKQHLINVLAILLLSGPTWIVGFFIKVDSSTTGVTRRILSYFFVILNAFQGLWIFIVFIARPKKVRKLWATTLCCLQLIRKDSLSGFTGSSKTRPTTLSSPSSGMNIKPATKGRYSLEEGQRSVRKAGSSEESYSESTT